MGAGEEGVGGRPWGATEEAARSGGMREEGPLSMRGEGDQTEPQS